MPANCSGPTVIKGARVVVSRLVRRLLRRDDGSAAIEFGLVITVNGRDLAFRAGVVEQPVDTTEGLAGRGDIALHCIRPADVRMKNFDLRAESCDSGNPLSDHLCGCHRGGD